MDKLKLYHFYVVDPENVCKDFVTSSKHSLNSEYIKKAQQEGWLTFPIAQLAERAFSEVP